MLKQDLSFTDFNGTDRQITLFFHLNKKEIVDIQTASPNGIQADMQDAIDSNDIHELLKFITNLVHKSYGVKSPDGLQFNKSPEILSQFVNSAYYDDFIMGLLENDGRKGEEFIRGIMPAKLVQEAENQIRGGQQAAVTEEVDRTQYAPSAREQFAASQQPTGNDFGQPQAPQPTPTPALSAAEDEGYQRYLAFKAQQEAAQNAASAPASPDAFRIREDEPTDHIGRPPHESFG